MCLYEISSCLCCIWSDKTRKMVGNFFCLAYNWFSLDLLLTTTIDIVSHFSSTSAEMKIKKYLMKFLLLLIVTKIQGRLIGHVGKVVFSPTLNFGPVSSVVQLLSRVSLNSRKSLLTIYNYFNSLLVSEC